MKRFIILWYFATLLIFVIYSYSQIDLNLTLSGNHLYQHFQKLLIELGYFARPASTILYILILISLFISYLFFLKLVVNKRISLKEIRNIIIASGIICFFAYSAFSHDIFNYMFDARIVTKYGLNPYNYKALDFSGDLWTRFMHWTHRTYPYGPIWLLVTIPFSLAGLQKFTLTLFLFKILFLISYLGSCYLIYLIPKNEKLVALTFFALNPLIIIESLISPHNDSLMLFFALLSIFFLISYKYVWSLLIMVISGGVKFVTAPLIIINLYHLLKKPRQILLKNLAMMLILIYLISINVVIYYKEILPWYAIPLIGFAAISESGYIKFIIPIMSFALLTKYIYFLYQGEWTTHSYNIYVMLLLGLLSLSTLSYFIFKKTNVLKLKI